MKQFVFFDFLLLGSLNCSAALYHPAQFEQANASYETCGAAISLPAGLTSKEAQSKQRHCDKSYRSDGGTVMSLAPSDVNLHDPAWIDRIPVLHIERVGIEDALKKHANATFRQSTRGNVRSIDSPPECRVRGKTTLTNISGANWHGWLAEDTYALDTHAKSTPEYCQRYSRSNRCVRMLIGNSKVSATMSQYCLARDATSFDLDSGISYDVFRQIVDSLRFIEE
ncbi:hypothetical protein [Burkholderia sp. WSM2230]|uniref:hypothetical protein n=1 Tax=Burkholderia sp. WSM2230 TaxID=944435 RepID=UPI0012EC1E2E|nr:hypothetical protein [Burkholderia sp. WSM2230]